MVTITDNYLNAVQKQKKKNSYKISVGGTPWSHLLTSQVGTGTT